MMIFRTPKRQPMHGYALTQHLERASDDLLQIEEGSLYPALQRMLKEGWLKAAWGISATNRRIRIYSLTPSGLERLERDVELRTHARRHPARARDRRFVSRKP